MKGTAQLLTDREAELLDYYRTLIDRVSHHKLEDDGGVMPDGFAGKHSVCDEAESQGSAHEFGQQSTLPVAAVPSEFFETEEVER